MYKKFDFSNINLSKRTLYVFLALFLIFLTYACDFMKREINDTLEQHMNSHIKNLSLIPAERFEREIGRISNFANYIETHPDSFPTILQNMEAAKETFKKRGYSTGILSVDYIPIQGERVSKEDFPNLSLTFQGDNVIDYCKGQGLLFASPIHSDGKIEYIIYGRYDEEFLEDTFGLRDDANENHIMIAERSGKVIIPYPEYSDEDKNFFADPEIVEGFSTVKEQLLKQRTSVIYSNTSRGNFFLLGANVPKTDFILLGFVSWRTAAGNIFMLNLLVLGLGVFFLIIFIILFKINEQARENEEKKRIAEDASRYKSAFLANMSHDIRTPLGGIIGFNELILKECKDPKFHKYSQNIADLAETLLALVNDILDLSKIEAAHMELQSQNYRLSEMLKNVVNMLTPKAAAKNLYFNINVARDIPNELSGDDVQLQRVVANFLTNAVKYTPCGGVEFSVEAEEKNEEEINLIFKVKDTGIGIRDEDKERLFSKFTRFDQQKNRSVEGTGLGLALSRELVHLMNGTINFESTYGEGTTFIVTIPQKVAGKDLIGNFYEHLKKEKAHENTELEFIAPEADVLIVDDDEVNREVFTNMLSRLKVKIDTASNGAGCLEKIKHKRYDIIFLDQMMPGLNGLETLEQAKAMTDNMSADVPIIAFTANAILGVKEKLLAAGFTDYLSKPVKSKEFENMLSKYLSPEKIQMPDDSLEDENEYNENEYIENDEYEEAGIDLLLLKGDYIDPEIGLEYTDGIEELYLKTLATYCRAKEEKQQNLEKAFEEENWTDYTTLIHSVKSTSLTIGCVELSNEAKALELAGNTYLSEYTSEDKKQQCIEYIKQHHAEVMLLYDNVADESLKILEEFEE